jgi:hypothetical protein
MAMSILSQNLIPIEQVSQYHGDSMTKGAKNINDYTRGGLRVLSSWRHSGKAETGEVRGKNEIIFSQKRNEIAVLMRGRRESMEKKYCRFFGGARSAIEEGQAINLNCLVGRRDGHLEAEGSLIEDRQKIDTEKAENTRWVNGYQGGGKTELLMPHAKYSKTRGEVIVIIISRLTPNHIHWNGIERPRQTPSCCERLECRFV